MIWPCEAFPLTIDDPRGRMLGEYRELFENNLFKNKMENNINLVNCMGRNGWKNNHNITC